MPKYQVKDKVTGKTIIFEGNKPPSRDIVMRELNKIRQGGQDAQSQGMRQTETTPTVERELDTGALMGPLYKHSMGREVKPAESRPDDVWTEVGGLLPNLSALGRHYKEGAEKFVKDPVGTAFPLTESIEGKGVIPELKRAGAVPLDLLSSLSSLADYASGNLLPEGRRDLKNILATEEGLGKSSIDMLVDMGTDPTTFMGAGMLKGAGKDAVERSIMETAKKSGAGDMAKDAISKFSEVPRETLERASATDEGLKRIKKAGIRATEDGVHNLASEIQGVVGKANLEQNMRAGDVASGILSKADEAAEGLQRKTMGGVESTIGARPITPAEAGRRLVSSTEQGREGLSRSFAEGKSVLDEAGVSTIKVGEENPLTQKMKGLMKESGYDPKVGYKMTESLGGRKVTQQDAQLLGDIVEKTKYANTPQDMISQLRNLRAMKAEKMPDGTFKYDGSLIKEVDGVYRDAIGETLEGIGGAEGKTLRDMWQDTNKQYAQGITAIENVEKGLNIPTANTERILDRVRGIPLEDLQKIQKVALENKNVAPVFEEIKLAMNDSLLFSSLDPSGDINPQRLQRIWSQISKEKRSIVFGDKSQRIQNVVNDAIELSDKIKAIKGDAKERARKITEIAKNSEIGKSLQGISGERKITNILNDNPANAKALAELRMIDEMFDTDFTSKAIGFYDARKLGVTKDGRLPLMNDIRTGKSLMGIKIAGDATRRVGEDLPVAGDMIVSLMSGISGLMGQSPAAAVAAYKAINSLSAAKRGVQKNLLPAALIAPTRGGEEEEDKSDLSVLGNLNR